MVESSFMILFMVGKLNFYLKKNVTMTINTWNMLKINSGV